MLATSSAATLEASLQGRPAVGIAELDRVAALRRRFDAKHLVRLEALGPLLEALPHFAVLEVDGRWATTYRTVYFDDEQLRTFRDHVQGRRLRYKIRTRRYDDGPAVRLGSGHAIVEAKSLALRGGAREALVRLGVRPESVSKYGLAVTATRPEVRGNRWLPALRRLRSSAA